MTELTTLPQETSPYAPKNIPIEYIRHLVETRGLNHKQTADILGCDRSNISRRCKEHNIGKKTLKLFNEAKVDILDSKLQMVLESLTPAKIEKASAYQLTGMANYFHQMVRLENEQSTSNVAYSDRVKMDEQYKKELHEILSQYDISPDLLPNPTDDTIET